MIVARRRNRSRWSAAITMGFALMATVAVVAEADAQDKRETEIAQLIKSVEQDPLRADAAVKELIRIGKPAVPALITTLKSPQSEVRWVVAAILQEIGPADGRILPALVESMSRVSSPPGWSYPFGPDEGLALATSLRAMGPDAVKPVIETLYHKQPFARATAALTLALFSDDRGLKLAEAPHPDPKPITLDREVIARLIATPRRQRGARTLGGRYGADDDRPVERPGGRGDRRTGQADQGPKRAGPDIRGCGCYSIRTEGQGSRRPACRLVSEGIPIAGCRGPRVARRGSRAGRSNADRGGTGQECRHPRKRGPCSGIDRIEGRRCPPGLTGRDG